MIEGEPAALFEALGVLVRFHTAERAAPTLRRALIELIVDRSGPDLDSRAAVGIPDTTAPDSATPPEGGAELPFASVKPPRTAPPSPVAARTTRRLPAKATRPNDPAASSPKSAATGLTSAEWLKLRRQVEAEMKRRQLDLAGLGAAIGRSFATMRHVMRKLSPPSMPILALLRDFMVGGPEQAQEAAKAPGRGNGGGNPSTAVAQAAAGNTGGATACPWRPRPSRP
jgi:hypothetical protein